MAPTSDSEFIVPEGVELNWLAPGNEDLGNEFFPLAMAACATAVLTLLMPCLISWVFGPPRLVLSGLLEGRLDRVALVVAHPDDEAMFFWPTLLQLRRAGVPLCVLCLSTGNADGLGEVRKLEMQRSCARLGISEDNLVVVDVEELQDGFHSWPEEVVSAQVLDFVRARPTRLVLTFDVRGVSGHPNHISTSIGVRRAAARAAVGGGGEACCCFKVLMLETVPLPQKYLGLVSLWSAPCADTAEVTVAASASVGTGPLACLPALAVHWSQFVWYRVLFTTFSRYAYLNTYVQA